MTTEQIVAFLLFTVVAAGTPGPSNIMLTAAGAQAGVLRGLPCLFGVTTGMGLMMVLVPFGLGSLVLRHPLVLKALNWGGAAFLLWLSWRIAISSSRIDAPPGRSPSARRAPSRPSTTRHRAPGCFRSRRWPS